MGWIADKVREKIEADARVSSHQLNRASDIGHPCHRYLTFQRLRWDEAQLPNPKLLMIFKEGREHERLVLKDLMEAGVEVLQTQRDYVDKDLQLVGRIDGMIRTERSFCPIEIKSISPASFHRIDSYQDMLESNRHWERMWAWQVQAYILLTLMTEVVVILKNKVTGELKDFAVGKDPTLLDGIKARCNVINRAVQEGRVLEVGDEIPEDVCKECPFNHICGRDYVRQGDMMVIDDPELQDLLEERAQLYDAYKRYQEIDRIITDRFKGQTAAIVGNWLITGKWVKRRGCTVPDGEYWRKKIIRIEGE
ncbi:MAG: hypothetical protein DRP12_03340 [Candidatus Aenigmatarchaeota archaeon]|nr:MAG: hypothetical protein DRP12_03340 [Candidatus Aenigmarchaeota archaeon]